MKKRKIAAIGAILAFAVFLLRPPLRNFLHNKNDHDMFVIRTGSGPKILLLHGLTGTHSYWAPLVKALAPHYEVITPDLIGFGESPWPATGYSMNDQIKTLTPFLNGEEPLTLVGHSLGALIAIEVAKRFPDKVNKVIILAPPSFDDRADLKRVLGSESQVESAMALDNFLAPFICHIHEVLGPLSFYLYRPFVSQKIPDNVVKDGIQHRWDSYNQSLESIVLQYKAIDELKSLMTPSLVIVGSKDKYSKNESLLKSQSNVQVIDGGHNFLWENPEATIKVIDNFLGI